MKWIANIENACHLDGGCRQQNKIWGLINTKTNKLHRLTFSKSLCELTATTLGGDFKAVRFSYMTDQPLKSGQRSSNGLYAIMSVEKDIVLRISLDKDIAAMYNECDSRYLAEAWLEEAPQ